MIKIQRLTEAKMRKYGCIIRPKKKGFGFSVITGDKEAKGWRIGYCRCKPDGVKMLECHPGSLESFEPVSGVSVILLAPPENPEKIEAFLLDKPVCLNKHVWHNIATLSDSADIKVTENYDIIGTKYYNLKKKLDFKLA